MVETRRLKELQGRAATLLDLPKEALVVALSGGADSAALAYLITTVGRALRAVHVNHGLPASAMLEEAARDVAKHVGVELAVLAVDVPSGASPEGQARTARYEALIGSLRVGEVLLTAHSLDDQAETVLLNLLRGTGPSGLTGIGDRPGLVHRPMLQISRSQTRELAALAGLPFVDDPTNLDPGLRRNQLRLEVIPELSSRFNPRLVEALARAASAIGADEQWLEGQAHDVPVIERGASFALPIGSLLAVARPIADRALRRGLTRARPPHPGSAEELAEVWAVVERTRKSVILAGGIEIAHDGPMLLFHRREDSGDQPAPVPLDVGSFTVGRFEVTVERADRVCRVAPIGLWSAIFPPDADLSAGIDEKGRLVVAAGSERAWVAGERRLPVAWYQPGTAGYLSVVAREGSGWTSNP